MVATTRFSIESIDDAKQRAIWNRNTMFDSPVGIIINENGNLLVSDLLNNRIRKIVFE